MAYMDPMGYRSHESLRAIPENGWKSSGSQTAMEPPAPSVTLLAPGPAPAPARTSRAKDCS